MELYYYEGSTRLGPVNPAQLKALAARGIVTPDTVVEAGSKKLLASKVKGLEFPPAAPPPVEPQAAALVPPPVPPVAPPVEPVAEPAAAEPKKETRTILTAFGATTVELDPDPLPEMPPASGPENPFEKSFRESAAELSASSKNISQVGWLFVFCGAVSGLIGVAAAVATDNAGALLPGIAALVGGLISAQVPFFLGKLGRFALAWTRYQENK